MEIDYDGNVNEYLAAQGPLSDTCADFWQVCIHILLQIHRSLC